jgi:nitroreductase
VINGEARARAGEALAEIAQGRASETTHALFLRAPACVMVVSTAAPHAKIPEWEQVLSAGAACFALLLAAHAMGYAGAWLSEWPAYDVRAREALGLQEHERIAGMIYLGSTAEPAVERVRANWRARTTRF